MRAIYLKKFSSYLWLMTILLAASSNLWAQATSKDEIRLRPYEKLTFFSGLDCRHDSERISLSFTLSLAQFPEIRNKKSRCQSETRGS